MKWGFRLLGGCLVFCGAIWIISCVYAAVFLASPLYALFAVPGAGPIWLGVWLCRRFWVKFERNREQNKFNCFAPGSIYVALKGLAKNSVRYLKPSGTLVNTARIFSMSNLGVRS